MRAGFLVAVMGLGAVCVAGAETAKLITEDALTTPPGETEVEARFIFGVVDREFDLGGGLIDRGDIRAQSLTLGLAHGLSPNVDASVSFKGLKARVDESGELVDDLWNLGVSLKWSFFQSGDGRWTLSWAPGVTAPIGPAAKQWELTTVLQNFWSLDNAIVLTWVGDRLNVSADAGVAIPLSASRFERTTIAVADAAVGYQALPWLQPVAELNYAHDIIQGPTANASILSLTVGAILPLAEAWRLDLGVSRGVVGRNKEALTSFAAIVTVAF